MTDCIVNYSDNSFKTPVQTPNKQVETNPEDIDVFAVNPIDGQTATNTAYAATSNTAAEDEIAAALGEISAQQGSEVEDGTGSTGNSNFMQNAIESFEQLDKWQVKHTINDYKYITNLNKGNSVYSKIDELLQNPNITDEQTAKLSDIKTRQDEVMKGYDKTYSDTKNTIGQQFDFMNGKNVADNEEYFSQIYGLAFGQMIKDDSDGNANLDLDEYRASELTSEKAITDMLGIELIDIPDEAIQDGFNVMDIDGDGSLNAAELALPYWVADQIDGSEDGKLDIDIMGYSLEEMKNPENKEIVLGMYDVIKSYMPE